MHAIPIVRGLPRHLSELAEEPRATGRRTPVKVAVAGKGGAGKSVVAGTLARVLARRGERVLALDSDLMPGLAFSLGADPPPPAAPLAGAAERPEGERWRLRKGIGPVRAIERFATEAPDGVVLLQAGKLSAEGLPAIMGSITAYYHVIHRLPRARVYAGWTIVGDLPAGPRHPAYDWMPYADTLLLVVEPTWQSALTARRVARVVRARDPGIAVLAAANKVREPGDAGRVAEMLGERPVAAIPADEAIGRAERAGAAPLDFAPRAPAVAAITALAERLSSRARAPER